ncbi:MAG: RNA polymerase sigma factor [Deltaproteobacteria bacterium]|nr:RNA polymerase sigma factor [Deltaproteobacteria bacterium]MBK8715790.1 RNA polymerase sigma factor [Deltaproteobacteria bacterium]MBP7288131.1 RNA polymerase sigma factor [Nannocystaceae bacterium]
MTDYPGAGDCEGGPVELLDRIASDDGGAAAFAALYREHFGFVYACLLRLGVPRASVEDAVQDVFVTVHRRLGEFEGRSSLRSWLFGIVRRVAFRHRRSASRAEHKLRALAVEPTDRDDPQSSLEQAQRGALLLRALADLDDDKRTALTLHVFEGLSGPELAKFLGIQLDTAYSRIKSARRELQRALARRGVTADAEELVADAKGSTAATPATARRVAAVLAMRLGNPAQVTATTAVAAASAWLGAKGIGVLAALAIGITATVVTRRASAPSPTPALAAVAAPAPTPATIEDAPPLPAELAPVGVVGAPVRSPAPGAATPTTPARASPPGNAPTDALAAALAAEVEQISAVKAAIDRDDPEAALALLAEHVRRFPDGQLASEREGYRAIALCRAGRRAAGRGEARVFVGRHPRSPLVARVSQDCELAAPTR